MNLDRTYTIADIASNHDGLLKRAKMLIRLAAESGADAAKFQLFTGKGLASERGFAAIGKPLYKVYDENALPREWIPELAATCKEAGIDFACTPYDYEAVDLLKPYVEYYKVGSGDITYILFLEYIAAQGKPVILSTGASDIGDVQRAVEALRGVPVTLLQCGMEYSGNDGVNLHHANLRVLSLYRTMFEGIICGLSDHTRSNTTVIAAVTLGATVIEKHFTDDNGREGPDHHFALEPDEWKRMVEAIRETETILDSANKKVEPNEYAWQTIARRCVRACRDIEEGETVTLDDVIALRPCEHLAIPANEIEDVWGYIANQPIRKGQAIKWTMLRG
jgi:sialic acid synthase SpsE